MKIKSIKQIEYKEDVYNLRIKDNHNYFANDICVSNCHSVKAMSVQKVIAKLNPLPKVCFGMSGTTGVGDDQWADSYTAQSFLGPLVAKVPPRYLIDRGYAPPVYFKMIYLDYLDDRKKELLAHSKKTNPADGGKLLNIENKIVIDNEKRFEYITTLISRVSKNSIVFFKDIKHGYGKKIYNRLKQACDNNYKIMYIDGGTDTDERNDYKKAMDVDDGRIKILVASFGTFSTGISMNNVHNIFLTESYKSETIIKQTIGRGMRQHASKNGIMVIDFVDDYRIGTYVNYIVNHAFEREAIYMKDYVREKSDFKKFKIKI